MGRVRVAAAAVAALGAALLPAACGPPGLAPAAAPPHPPVRVRAAGRPTALQVAPGGLAPAFSPSVHDYVTSCAPGRNRVTLTVAAGPKGAVATTTVTLVEDQAAVLAGAGPGGPYWIRCLPHDFPVLAVQEPGRPPPGWYLTGNLTPSAGHTSGTYAMVLDPNGTPVWYRALPSGAFDVEPAGRDVLAYRLLDLRSGAESRLPAPIPPTDPHELRQLPNGDRMMFATPLRSGYDLGWLDPRFAAASGTIVDCVVQEVSPNGHLVWQWRASDHVALSETVGPELPMMPDRREAADVFHCNSVDVDATGRQVLVSMRNASAVYLVSRQTGEVRWKLSGTPPAEPAVRHLAVVGDPEGEFSEQHDARFEPGGRVSMFDNHTRLRFAARAVEYLVDEAAGTATLDWELPQPEGSLSLATGSFRRALDGDDNVVDWGLVDGRPSGFTEVDREGRVLLDVTYPNHEVSYRAVKVPPESLDADLLRAAMERRPAP